MTEYQVGQILKVSGEIAVITHIIKNHHKPEHMIYVIFLDGVSGMTTNLLLDKEKAVVIAKYDTWKDAVQSKEFNPERLLN